MRLLLLSFLFLISLHPLSVEAQQVRQNSQILYELSVDLRVGDKLIGQPKLIIAPGASAIISNAVDGGYSLKADIGTNGGVSGSSIQLKTEIYLADQDKWVVLGKPAIFLHKDQSVSFSGTAKSGKNFTVNYLLKQVDANKFSGVAKFGQNPCNAAKIYAWSRAMSRPVSFVSAATQVGGTIGACCNLCKNIRCCSSGPMCCRDQTNCYGKECCNHENPL